MHTCMQRRKEIIKTKMVQVTVDWGTCYTRLESPTAKLQPHFIVRRNGFWTPSELEEIWAPFLGAGILAGPLCLTQTSPCGQTSLYLTPWISHNKRKWTSCPPFPPAEGQDAMYSAYCCFLTFTPGSSTRRVGSSPVLLMKEASSTSLPHLGGWATGLASLPTA